MFKKPELPRCQRGHRPWDPPAVIKFPGVKMQRISSQQLHIECYHVQGTGLGAKNRDELVGWISMTATLRWLSYNLTAGQQIISVKHGNCIIHTPLDLPSEGLDLHHSNPGYPRDQFRESPLWKLVFFSHHHIHREVWECIFPGGVYSVIYHFCHLS